MLSLLGDWKEVFVIRRLKKFHWQQFTAVGSRSFSKVCRPWSKSSRHRSRSNWDAARCSDGSKLGLQVISSRKAVVWDRSPSSCSKSWKCFETQCLVKSWSQKLELRRKVITENFMPENVKNAHGRWWTHNGVLSISGRFYLGRFVSRIRWRRCGWKLQN